MKKIFGILILLLPFASCEKDSLDTYTLKFYGDASEDIGYSVTITSTGYIIAGQLEILTRNNGYIVDSLSDKQLAIIKTDWQGNVIWKVTEGGTGDDWGTKVIQLTDGSLIVIGTTTDGTPAPSGQGEQVFVVKVSASGQVLWQKSYGDEESAPGQNGNQRGRDIIPTDDGFMIFGTTDLERQPLTDSTGNKAGFSDICLIKINANGDYIESFAYGYPGNDYASVIKKDGNNFIVLGTTDRLLPGQELNNLLLVKINSVGYATEPVIIGGTEDEYAADLEITADGYLIAGTVGSQSVSQQALVTKINKANIYANPLFTSKFRIGDASTSINAMHILGDDRYVLAGSQVTTSGSSMLVCSIDSDGNKIAGSEIIKGNTGEQVAFDVVSGDDGYVIAVGRNKYDVNSMMSFLKFRY